MRRRILDPERVLPPARFMIGRKVGIEAAIMTTLLSTQANIVRVTNDPEEVSEWQEVGWRC